MKILEKIPQKVLIILLISFAVVFGGGITIYNMYNEGKLGTTNKSISNELSKNTDNSVFPQKKENEKIIEKKNEQPTYEYSISANNLYSEYDKNEIAADEKYKNKIIKITGIVSNINKIKLTGDLLVSLKGNSNEMIDDFLTVNCYLLETEVSKASKLNVNQKITLIGRVIGQGLIGEVELRECSILH